MRRGRLHPSADERGFTMIEMIVAVVIIAILAGIGIPTFISAKGRASDRRVEVNLRTASKAAWTYVVQHQEGWDTTPPALAELAAIEPVINWVAGDVASADPNTISVAHDADGQELAMAVRSNNGGCVYLRLSLVTVESRHLDDDAVECRGVDYVNGPNTGW